MNMCNRSIITLLMVLSTFITYSHTGRAFMMEASSEEQIPLEQYLTELGEATNSFFTIEEGYKEGGDVTSLLSLMLRRPAQKMTVQVALEMLQRDAQNLSFLVNKQQPHIIHIIDRRLQQQKGYALDGVIKKIDFKGTVNDVLIEIGKRRILLSPPTSIATEEMLVWDLETVVHERGEPKGERCSFNFSPAE
jgi:hypothetical protein